MNKHLEADHVSLMPAVFSFSCVTLGKLFNLCKPQFLQLHEIIHRVIGKIKGCARTALSIMPGL